MYICITLLVRYNMLWNFSLPSSIYSSIIQIPSYSPSRLYNLSLVFDLSLSSITQRWFDTAPTPTPHSFTRLAHTQKRTKTTNTPGKDHRTSPFKQKPSNIHTCQKRAIASNPCPEVNVDHSMLCAGGGISHSTVHNCKGLFRGAWICAQVVD